MNIKDELSQQLTVSVIGGQQITVWDHWRLYLNPELTMALAGMVEDRLRAFVDRLDYLCPIPKGGMPLASVVAHRLELPVLNFWWDKGVYCRNHIPQSPRVVLFDPDVKSGWALHSALMAIDSVQPQIECLLTIVYDDAYPPDFTIRLKEAWYQQNKIVHLFTMSELIRHSATSSE